MGGSKKPAARQTNKAAAGAKKKAGGSSSSSSSGGAAADKQAKEGKAGRKQRGAASHCDSLRDPLDRELALLGLRVKNITADGNCFFRALSDQLHGDEGQHSDLRARVVGLMRGSPDEFAPFVEDDASLDQHLARMAREGVWAGHLEVQAASLLLEANIAIYQAGQPRWCVMNFKEGSRMLHLSYHDGQHYNSVRRGGDYVRGTPADIPQDLAGVAPLADTAQAQAAWSAADEQAVAQGTGCDDTALIRQQLGRVGGDVDAAIEGVIEVLAAAADAADAAAAADAAEVEGQGGEGGQAAVAAQEEPGEEATQGTGQGAEVGAAHAPPGPGAGSGGATAAAAAAIRAGAAGPDVSGGPCGGAPAEAGAEAGADSGQRRAAAAPQGAAGDQGGPAALLDPQPPPPRAAAAAAAAATGSGGAGDAGPAGHSTGGTSGGGCAPAGSKGVKLHARPGITIAGGASSGTARARHGDKGGERAPSRNKACPCGSGRKHKLCCGAGGERRGGAQKQDQQQEGLQALQLATLHI